MNETKDENHMIISLYVENDFENMQHSFIMKKM